MCVCVCVFLTTALICASVHSFFAMSVNVGCMSMHIFRQKQSKRKDFLSVLSTISSARVSVPVSRKNEESVEIFILVIFTVLKCSGRVDLSVSVLHGQTEAAQKVKERERHN